MSIFSFLGKAAKTVGKVALGAVGAVTGIQIGGNNQMQTASQPQGSQVQQPGNFLNDLGKAVDAINSVHPTITVVHEVDTKNLTSRLPSWAIPAGVGLLAIMMLRGGGRR